ncbi:hypothetical protein [Epilithonimonas hispanica]|uniref:PBCV-specific basic adaptor domain-containing protein n=1 Tax=Epilithonimonas hispanica TaxID=358687 RepID=A0A3D9D2S2_9FLAO|nr:hypothetical protein [Epilithonimonas hispanica]REC72303.1 hypothetical protein DRF58_03340 [Epilithonimonas hispanica]
MKNLLSALLLTFGVGLATSQTTAPTAVKKQAQKTEKQAKKVEAKAEKTATASTVKLKKDGTPDKRYKEAKTLKKDGTPDKRYKVNK